MAKKNSQTSPKKISRFQKHTAVIFLLASALVIFFIIYFAFAKTVIVLTSPPEKIESTFSLQIGEPSKESKFARLPGMVVETTFTGTQNFPAHGTPQTVEDYATGVVVIHNESSHEQPLVAQTRLVTDSGVLFRTQETVRVSAGQTVTVAVKADQKGTSGNIPPSRLTVVALWKGLQAQIYATNEAAFTGGIRSQAVLTEQDIADAKNTHTAVLEKDAPKKLQDVVSRDFQELTLDSQNIITELVSSESSATAGTTVENFDLTTTVRARGLAYDSEALNEFCLQEIQSVLEPYQRLLPQTISCVAKRTKPADSSANPILSVTAKAEADLKLSHRIFDQEKLTGLTSDEVKKYFAAIPEVKKIHVKFSPFWNFTTPLVPDHIDVQLEP